MRVVVTRISLLGCTATRLARCVAPSRSPLSLTITHNIHVHNGEHERSRQYRQVQKSGVYLSLTV